MFLKYDVVPGNEMDLLHGWTHEMLMELYWYYGMHVKDMLYRKRRISGKFNEEKPIPDEEYWLMVIDPKHPVSVIRRVYWFLGPNLARKFSGWPVKNDIRPEDWDPRDEVSELEYRVTNAQQIEDRDFAWQLRGGNEY
jgi:hypothetical protein